VATTSSGTPATSAELALVCRSKPVLAFHTPGHAFEQALQVLVDGLRPHAVASGRWYAVGKLGDRFDASVGIHQLHAADAGQLQVVHLADEVRPGRHVARPPGCPPRQRDWRWRSQWSSAT
jgi:hypothetical protein